MSPLTAAATGGGSCPLRKDTPSACSSRTVVASVNGRRPPSTFSRVERLSLASSASDCREMRRRAISSRMISAICRLCSAESCLSGVCIIAPFEFRHPRAFSVLIESEPRLYLIVLTRFLHANRYHPRIRSEGMLRSKTLFSRRTIHHKAAQLRLRLGAPKQLVAEQCRSFCSRQITEFRTTAGDEKPFGVT